MDQEELKARTKALALGVMRLLEAVPRCRAADVVSRQLLRSATSVGANYRSVCRARSRAEFIARMGIVEEEADETGYWLELMTEHGLVERDRVEDLLGEANEIVAVAVASIRTARRGK